MAVFENKDLYPTPNEVINLMGLNAFSKVVLEPQAGFGNIVDWLLKNGAKEVLTCEIEKDLQISLQSKSTFIGADFLAVKPEQISHVELIVMNPPFSNAEEHIIHAFKIAPNGCKIVSLCNYETIYKKIRYRELAALIRDNGSTKDLGQCFENAERRTDVTIGLVTLNKSLIDSNGFDTSGFFMDDDEEHQENGIMSYNSVRAVVNNYIGCIKGFEEIKKVQDNLNFNLSSMGVGSIAFKMGRTNRGNDEMTTVEQFAKELQYQSWKRIFADMGMEKYVTSEVMKKINTFINEQIKVPFTMKNVYHMLDVIFQTREETFKQSLEEAIDNFTKHTHENRYGVEGWKTNMGHMLNKKFICEYVCDSEWGYNRVKYDTYNVRKLNDLTKVLCNLNNANYGNLLTTFDENGKIEGLQLSGDIHNMNNKEENMDTNTWYDYGFFDVKFFKKGTAHLKFKDEKVWHRLNQAYAKIKGFTLPDAM